MNPAIAEALAALVLSIHPGGVAARKGDALCVALGLDADASWDDVATALRALARPDVGLPAGWTEHPPSIGDERSVYFAEEDDTGRLVFLTVYARRTAEWSGAVAPPAVYLHLLRAAGVAS